MRVALLSRSAYPLHPPGGLEKAVYLLARHLRARGVESVLFTRPASGGSAGVEAFPGEVVTLPYGSLSGVRHGRVLDRTLLYPAFARRLGVAVAEAVRSGRVDVVDAQGLSALGYGRARVRDRRLRAPLVMNPQGLEEHKTSGLKRLALTRLRSLSREAARLSDRVVATDESTRGEVPALLGVPESKVVVLPNGIDVDEILALTPASPRSVVASVAPALAGASPVFLSVGRLEAYKGFGDTLEALARLAKAGVLPHGWAWVVAGEGPLRTVLETRGRALLGTHLHLTGRVDDPTLHALYARADVFVHVPRFEGSSLVTLEAMAHGLPVAASRAGGLPDKVTDGGTGRLVAVGDVHALADALSDLAARPGFSRDCGERGRQRLLKLFSWPALAERVEALYRELIDEARA